MAAVGGAIRSLPKLSKEIVFVEPLTQKQTSASVKMPVGCWSQKLFTFGGSGTILD